MNTRGLNNGDADPQDDGDLDVLDKCLNACSDVKEDLSDAEGNDNDNDDDNVPDRD